MRPFIETGVIIAACGSAIFWFMSATCRLPRFKPGTDELDMDPNCPKLCRESIDGIFWAAGLMGITAMLSAWARFLG